MVMAVCGRKTGVPANTDGGGVVVAVGNACVGNGVFVGAGGGGAAQAANKSKAKRKVHSCRFIFHSFFKTMSKLARAGSDLFSRLDELPDGKCLIQYSTRERKISIL
jgi:hypothetical protein